MAFSGNDGRKLTFFEERNGFPVMYNEFLRKTRNPKEAMKLAKATWESLPEDEQEARKEAAKAKWRATHPPPPEESPEERMR